MLTEYSTSLVNYEVMLEDEALIAVVVSREHELGSAVEVSLDDL